MHAGLASWNFDRMFTGDVWWGGGGGGRLLMYETKKKTFVVNFPVLLSD